MLIKIVPMGPDPNKPIWGLECKRYKLKVSGQVDPKDLDEFVRGYDVDVVHEPGGEYKNEWDVQIGGPFKLLLLDWGMETAQSIVIRSSVNVYIIGPDGATIDKFGIG